MQILESWKYVRNGSLNIHGNFTLSKYCQYVDREGKKARAMGLCVRALYSRCQRLDVLEFPTYNSAANFCEVGWVSAENAIRGIVFPQRPAHFYSSAGHYSDNSQTSNYLDEWMQQGICVSAITTIPQTHSSRSIRISSLSAPPPPYHTAS